MAIGIIGANGADRCRMRSSPRIRLAASFRVLHSAAATWGSEGHINGGRKAAHKSAFVAAVQTSEDGHPLYMRLTPVADFTNAEMAQWAKHCLAPTSHVVSDGTRAFAQVLQAGATHERYVTGGGRQGARTPQLRWVNTMLGNLKTSLAGTLHSFEHARYGARYLVGPAKFTQPPRPSDLRQSSSPSVPLSALRPTWRAAQIAAQKGP